jgi:PhnB protein
LGCFVSPAIRRKSSLAVIFFSHSDLAVLVYTSSANFRDLEVFMSVKPIPDGYHSLTPFLTVRDAARAIEFYKNAFGAVERGVMKGPDGKIMHAELMIGDSIVMLSDEFPEFGALSPQSTGGVGMGLHIYVDGVDAAFDRAVKAGAEVEMPVMDQFWGDRYGKLKDPFGHKWSIATHTADLSVEEMKHGMDEAMAKMPMPKSA